VKHGSPPDRVYTAAILRDEIRRLWPLRHARLFYRHVIRSDAHTIRRMEARQS